MGPCENLDEKTYKLFLDLVGYQKEDAKMEECKMPSSGDIEQDIFNEKLKSEGVLDEF
jgi:hypothetical protein